MPNDDALPRSKFDQAGVVSRCPYCLARMHAWPPIGTRIVFLNSSDVGHSGVVMSDQWGSCPSDRFLVQMAYDKAGTSRMVKPNHDLFLDVEMLVVPPWMPPVSINDNAMLHDSLRYALDTPAVSDDRQVLDELLRLVIATCWRRRLELAPVA